MKETPIETVKQILELRKQKKRYSEIAQELNITKDKARYYCMVYGLEDLVTSISYTQEEDDIIKDLYLNQGMTPSEIAVKLQKSPQGIRKYLNRHGIKKPRKYTVNKDNIDKVELPPPIKDTVFYPERKITTKKVTINGKRYQDVSEVYGL